MKTHRLIAKVVIALTGAVLGSRALWADPPAPIPPALSPRGFVEPKTRVVYYMEPDLRRIDAICPESKVLWRCEVIPPSAKPKARIITFRPDETNKSLIDVWYDDCTAICSYGIIDKQSGAFTKRGAD